ncbi:hypothetical protein NVP1131O_34 [Vibrio phage 1.131.O._10N.222.49.A8]|nr:hypothetical protein NVP1131O_34 [Vibrio phage 1.131.O._10N.222.49.A8]
MNPDLEAIFIDLKEKYPGLTYGVRDTQQLKMDQALRNEIAKEKRKEHFAKMKPQKARELTEEDVRKSGRLD